MNALLSHFSKNFIYDNLDAIPLDDLSSDIAKTLILRLCAIGENELALDLYTKRRSWSEEKIEILLTFSCNFNEPLSSNFVNQAIEYAISLNNGLFDDERAFEDKRNPVIALAVTILGESGRVNSARKLVKHIEFNLLKYILPGNIDKLVQDVYPYIEKDYLLDLFFNNTKLTDSEDYQNIVRMSYIFLVSQNNSLGLELIKEGGKGFLRPELIPGLVKNLSESQVQDLFEFMFSKDCNLYGYESQLFELIPFLSLSQLIDLYNFLVVQFERSHYIKKGSLPQYKSLSPISHVPIKKRSEKSFRQQEMNLDYVKEHNRFCKKIISIWNLCLMTVKTF